MPGTPSRDQHRRGSRPSTSGISEPVDQLRTSTPTEVHCADDQAMTGSSPVVQADDADGAEAAFWHYHGVGATTASSRIAESRVAVVTLGCSEGAPLEQALGSSGVPMGEPADLVTVVTDDYLESGLHDLNRAALLSGRPWMLTKLVGTTVWLGPVFVPGRTGCWACLAQRLEANHQAERYLSRKLGLPRTFVHSPASVPASIHVGASLAATEIVTWLATGSSNLVGQVVTMAVLTGRMETHRLVRRPQCPVCGTRGDARHGAGNGSTPVQLASSPKRYRHDGGHRTLLPEETWERFRHHVDPITGVIATMQEHAPDQAHVTFGFTAVHDFPMFRDDIEVLRENMQGRSGGKGASVAQARVSALGEAVERYSVIWRGEEEVTFPGTARMLGDRAVPLADCLGFSKTQVENREQWNRSLLDLHHLVPTPLDPDLEIAWTSIWSLTEQREVAIPSAYCYYAHPDMRHFICIADSNGTAAGNTFEEAVYQGFLELIERDGVAIWWYNRTPRPALDLDSFGLPYVAELQDYYRQRHRDMWVLDLTNDLGIPIFAALSARTDYPVEDIIMGFGAHLDPRIALLRALTELNQFEPMVSTRQPDGSATYLANNEGTVRWLKAATRTGQPYVAPSPAASRSADQFRDLSTDDIRDDLLASVEVARKAGLETLVLDHTRPDVEMAVARVVIPGLCHFWRRLGQPRLYEVPVTLGWLNHPTAEEDLNPFSIFF